eukprot:s1385_g3.t1
MLASTTTHSSVHIRKSCKRFISFTARWRERVRSQHPVVDELIFSLTIRLYPMALFGISLGLAPCVLRFADTTFQAQVRARSPHHLLGMAIAFASLSRCFSTI